MSGERIADAELAAFLCSARDQAGDGRVPEIAELRRSARARAAARTPGPAMPTADTLIAGVPVRVYQSGLHPVVVYAHGGGFVLGDLDTHDAQARRLAAAASTTVVAVDYRRAPEYPWPAAVDDMAGVVARLGSDRAPVAVAGDSAGALIAVLAALRVRERVPLLAQLLVCPNADPTLALPSVAAKARGWLFDVEALRGWLGMWLPEPAVRASDAANLLAADLSGLPPAVVVTAEHDPLRDEGDAYAARLIDAGVPVRYRCEIGLVHNFPTLRDVSPAAAAAEDRFLADAAALLHSPAAAGAVDVDWQ